MRRARPFPSPFWRSFQKELPDFRWIADLFQIAQGIRQLRLVEIGQVPFVVFNVNQGAAPPDRFHEVIGKKLGQQVRQYDFSIGGGRLDERC